MRPITCDPALMTPKKRSAADAAAASLTVPMADKVRRAAEAELRALKGERARLRRLEADLAARELAAVARARGAAVPWREIAGWMDRSSSNVCAQFKPHLDVKVTVAVVRPEDEVEPLPPARAKPARR